MAKFLYSTPDNAVLEDKSLTSTEYRVYNYLRSLVLGQNNPRIIVKVMVIAEAMGLSRRSIQYALKKLDEKGIVKRIFRKSASNPKYNAPSLFVIHGRHATCYATQEQQTPIWVQPTAPISATNCTQVLEAFVLESESKGTNLTGKPELPISVSTYISSLTPELVSETKAKEESPLTLETHGAVRQNEEHETEILVAGNIQLDLEGIPDMLVPTARVILTLSGRKKLAPDEIRLLKEMLVKHTPNRIEREAVYRAKWFREHGRNPKSLTVYYLHKILMGQPATYTPEVASGKPSKRHQKSAKSTPKTNGVQYGGAESKSEPAELAMPVAEAEKVIAEYEPAKKPGMEIPTALLELYEGIRKHGREGLTLEDYLRMKFPGASNEELELGRGVNERDCQKAFELDVCCALCDNPDECSLPCGCAKGRSYPVINLAEDKWTKRKALRTGWDMCLKCKHDQSAKQEISPELESRMTECGLAQSQKGQTFEAYTPSTPELIVAKAKAILAAKSGKNLVLAGRAGTGKTHLAIAIAIDAMKSGKKALFTTLNDMLGNLAQANRDNTDPFGMMMKYKSVPVLVLDDWDKAGMTDSRLGYLFDVINYRYTNGLQTIVTTNAPDMAGMEFRWYAGKAEPIMSRLLENGDFVTIREAKNYRLTHKNSPNSDANAAESVVAPAPELKTAGPEVSEANNAPIERTSADMLSGRETPKRKHSCVENKPEQAQPALDEQRAKEERDERLRLLNEFFDAREQQQREEQEEFSEPQTEEEWAELLDDGGFGQYTSEEITELLFGGNPEEYISQPCETQAVSESAGGGNIILTEPSYDWDDGEDEIDEADLKLYGGLYTD